MKITKEDYLSALTRVRSLFKEFSVRGHNQKNEVAQTQRQNLSAKDQCHLLNSLAELNTVVAMALANRAGHLHCDTYRMVSHPGHGIMFEDLFDQEQYLRHKLASLQFTVQLMGILSLLEVDFDKGIIKDLNIIAFHKKDDPEAAPAEVRVALPVSVVQEVEQQVPVYA